MVKTSEKRVSDNSKDSDSGKTNFSPSQLSQYFRESITELKKVHSPTRAETIQATMVTLAIMVFVALVLFMFDVVFKKLMDALLA